MLQKRRLRSWVCQTNTENILKALDINGITFSRMLFLKIQLFSSQKIFGVLPFFAKTYHAKIDFKN